MKRLILVGNGFDLAHGLKTSYCDFIKWYLAEALNNFHSSNNFEDELISIKHRSRGSHYILNGFPTKPEKSIEALRSLQNSPDHSVSYKSDLLRETINKVDELNWVDVELEFFETMIKYQSRNQPYNVKDVITLNNQFKYLKYKLDRYLLLQQSQNQKLIPDENILNIFREEFKWRDFDTGFNEGEGDKFRMDLIKKDERLLYPEETLILNFNYTNTLENYIAKLKQFNYHKNISINYIHGLLDTLDHPIIFGFGDEYNSQYKQLEEQYNNDVFEHMKSYWYFKSSNYRELIRYLNSDMFQVFILGHSCGLSDRTMFREIFDHENCKSVKIFYYVKPDGTNDYFDKTVQLGRHFGNNGRMRKKIVELNESSVFPQPDVLQS